MARKVKPTTAWAKARVTEGLRKARVAEGLLETRVSFAQKGFDCNGYVIAFPYGLIDIAVLTTS